MSTKTLLDLCTHKYSLRTSRREITSIFVVNSEKKLSLIFLHMRNFLWILSMNLSQYFHPLKPGCHTAGTKTHAFLMVQLFCRSIVHTNRNRVQCYHSKGRKMSERLFIDIMVWLHWARFRLMSSFMRESFWILNKIWEYYWIIVHFQEWRSTPRRTLRECERIFYCAKNHPVGAHTHTYTFVHADFEFE